jgi:hypothetical protein
MMLVTCVSVIFKYEMCLDDSISVKRTCRIFMTVSNFLNSFLFLKLSYNTAFLGSWDSVVGIATGYGRSRYLLGLLPSNGMHNPIILLCVGPCLRSRCTAMR